MEEIIEDNSKANELVELIENGDLHGARKLLALEKAKRLYDNGDFDKANNLKNQYEADADLGNYKKIEFTAELINQISQLDCRHFINLIFSIVKLESKDDDDYEALIKWCMHNAVKQNNLVYLNNFYGRGRCNYFYADVGISYNSLLKEGTKVENWLDSDFITKLRILTVLSEKGSTLWGFYQDDKNKAKALDKFVKTSHQYCGIYTRVVCPNLLRLNTFRALEWIFLHHLKTYVDKFFKPKEEIQWIAKQWEAFVEASANAIKHDPYLLKAIEKEFVFHFPQAPEAKNILLDGVPISHYFAGIIVLHFCDIDPSRHPFKKSFFELNWQMVVECYFNEQYDDNRKALLDKLKKTINVENNEQPTIHQASLNTLLAHISQLDQTRKKYPSKSMLQVIDKDSFGKIIKYLIEKGDMKSVARARRISKKWQQAIDKMPIWKQMLKEIGGRVWDLNNEMKVEQFSPASKYVFQCYGFIIKSVNSRHRSKEIWGILTNNTRLALEDKYLGRYYKGTSDRFFISNVMNIAAAYGRTDVVMHLKISCLISVGNISGLAQAIPHHNWPLTKTITLINQPFLNAVAYCQIDTVQHCLNYILSTYTAEQSHSCITQAAHMAFKIQYPEESPELIAMLLNVIFSDNYKPYLQGQHVSAWLSSSAVINDSTGFEQLIDIINLPEPLDSPIKINSRTLIKYTRVDRLKKLLDTKKIYLPSIYNCMLETLPDLGIIEVMTKNCIGNMIFLIEQFQLYKNSFDDEEQQRAENERFNSAHEMLDNNRTAGRYYTDHEFSYFKSILQSIWKNRTKYLPEADEQNDENNNNDVATSVMLANASTQKEI